MIIHDDDSYLNCVWLNVWTWILDNANVVELVNVIGGVLLHCRCYVGVVCPCIISYVEM
jgi:hypothetical protein